MNEWISGGRSRIVVMSRVEVRMKEGEEEESAAEDGGKKKRRGWL